MPYSFPASCVNWESVLVHFLPIRELREGWIIIKYKKNVTEIASVVSMMTVSGT